MFICQSFVIKVDLYLIDETTLLLILSFSSLLSLFEVIFIALRALIIVQERGVQWWIVLLDNLTAMINATVIPCRRLIAIRCSRLRNELAVVIVKSLRLLWGRCITDLKNMWNTSNLGKISLHDVHGVISTCNRIMWLHLFHTDRVSFDIQPLTSLLGAAERFRANLWQTLPYTSQITMLTAVGGRSHAIVRNDRWVLDHCRILKNC